jgi:hypothetical protein
MNDQAAPEELEPKEEVTRNILRGNMTDRDIKRELLAVIDRVRAEAELIERPAGIFLLFNAADKDAIIHGGGRPEDYLTLLRFFHRTMPSLINEFLKKFKAVPPTEAPPGPPAGEGSHET